MKSFFVYKGVNRDKPHPFGLSGHWEMKGRIYEC